MMNQIKELKYQNKKECIIEISLIILESQKKITISLFISAPVTVLELKKFISKDFDLNIEDMIFFYPLKGIIDNTYKFQAEPNQKISLDLILDNKKKDIDKLDNEISLKSNEYKKLPINNFSDVNLLKTQNNVNNTCQKLIDSINNKKGCHLFNSINCYDKKNVNALNYNININFNESQKTNNFNINNKTNIPQIKPNKCNFVLTKIDNKQKMYNETLLGKKRNNPATFKTTILNKEKEDTKSKLLDRPQGNNNYKIVNFNINKINNAQERPSKF